jgi:HlyD family secretion protein
MKQVSKPRKIAAAVAVALALSAGGYGAYAGMFGSDDPQPFFGSVDVRDVSVGFRVSGRITEVLVDEGSTVQAGQVLARLDAEPYRRMRDESLATRDAAAARLALLVKGYNPEAVARARAQLDAARATLSNAEKNHDRLGELRASGSSSQSALDEAEAAHAQAAANARAAEQEYKQLRKGYRSEEIAEARANLAKADAAYSRVQLQLDDTELKAPADGVVQTRAIEPGSMVEAGGAGLVIANRDDTWVRAYVSEPALGQTVPGARVAVYTDSRPDQPYQGRIGSVSPRAEFTPRTVETTDLRTSLVYRVRVLIDQPDAALRQGMPVTVRLMKRANKS